MVHELGHNLSLHHAPCGRNIKFLDESYPYPDGRIGAWGYKFKTSSLVKPGIRDLMSYCDPSWISDYYFTNALRHRLDVEPLEAAARRPAPARSLLIWGGADRDGTPHLEPVFVIDAPPSLPREDGPYRLVGADADGTEIFALSFAMPTIADGDGRSSFAFVLPVQSGWYDTLALITLSGLEGSFAIDAESDNPAVIVRDPRNGQVRAIYSDLPPAITRTEAMDLSPEPGLEVLFSRGLPGQVR